MLTKVIADRMALRGDESSGMVVQDRNGMTAWAGEFHSVVGEGKVAKFAAGCNLDEVSWIYLYLADGLVALVDPADAVRRGL